MTLVTLTGKPEHYLNDHFFEVLGVVSSGYESLIKEISDEFPDVHIFIHGYDYLIPNNGKYLGQPMGRRGIVEPELQKAIMKALINEFNSVLKNLSDGREKVHYINCRGSVDPSEWYDEIHPTSRGFEGVAKRFKDELRKNTATFK